MFLFNPSILEMKLLVRFSFFKKRNLDKSGISLISLSLKSTSSKFNGALH